jgi:hypothetical protein
VNGEGNKTTLKGNEETRSACAEMWNEIRLIIFSFMTPVDF